MTIRYVNVYAPLETKAKFTTCKYTNAHCTETSAEKDNYKSGSRCNVQSLVGVPNVKLHLSTASSRYWD